MGSKLLVLCHIHTRMSVGADFIYIKAYGDKQVVPVLTAIDAETGMAMAVQVQDKSQQFHYLVKCVPLAVCCAAVVVGDCLLCLCSWCRLDTTSCAEGV